MARPSPTQVRPTLRRRRRKDAASLAGTAPPPDTPLTFARHALRLGRQSPLGHERRRRRQPPPHQPRRRNQAGETGWGATELRSCSPKLFRKFLFQSAGSQQDSGLPRPFRSTLPATAHARCYRLPSRIQPTSVRRPALHHLPVRAGFYQLRVSWRSLAARALWISRLHQSSRSRRNLRNTWSG